MTSITIDPLLLEYGLPALGLGLFLGALISWSFYRRRQHALEAQIKNQESVQQEREIAFEAANAQLTRAFSDLANQSLKSNSETFLQLAEQNLGTHQEKAKRELSEREKAVEALVKPIREALDASQKQIAELNKSIASEEKGRDGLKR